MSHAFQSKQKRVGSLLLSKGNIVDDGNEMCIKQNNSASQHYAPYNHGVNEPFFGTLVGSPSLCFIIVTKVTTSLSHHNDTFVIRRYTHLHGKYELIDFCWQAPIIGSASSGNKKSCKVSGKRKVSKPCSWKLSFASIQRIRRSERGAQEEIREDACRNDVTLLVGWARAGGGAKFSSRAKLLRVCVSLLF